MLNCHDNYMTTIMALSVIFCLMTEDFAFVLMYRVETSQLI